MFSKHLFLLCCVSLRGDWSCAKVKAGSRHDSRAACSADCFVILFADNWWHNHRAERRRNWLQCKDCISLRLCAWLHSCKERFGVFSYLANKWPGFVFVVCFSLRGKLRFGFVFPFLLKDLSRVRPSVFPEHTQNINLATSSCPQKHSSLIAELTNLILPWN